MRQWRGSARCDKDRQRLMSSARSTNSAAQTAQRRQRTGAQRRHAREQDRMLRETTIKRSRRSHQRSPLTRGGRAKSQWGLTAQRNRRCSHDACMPHNVRWVRLADTLVNDKRPEACCCTAHTRAERASGTAADETRPRTAPFQPAPPPRCALAIHRLPRSNRAVAMDARPLFPARRSALGSACALFRVTSAAVQRALIAFRARFARVVQRLLVTTSAPHRPSSPLLVCSSASPPPHSSLTRRRHELCAQMRRVR